MIQWWYSLAGQATGPYDIDGLAQLFRTGNVDAQTLVWHEGMSSWQAIAQLPELRGVVMPAPALRPLAEPNSGPNSNPNSPYAVNSQPGYPARNNTIVIVLAVVAVLLAVLALAAGAAIWKGYSNAHAQREQALQRQTTPVAGTAQPAQVWQNPVTLLQAYVDADWQLSTSPDATGAWYTFAQADKSAGILLKASPENVANTTLREVVPEISSALRTLGFQLDGAGQYTEDEALPGWLLTGSSSQYPDKKISMQVVQTKKNFWVIITIKPINSPGYEEKLQSLHHAIISTIT